MSIVPPASATLIWAFPTQFEEVRCLVWEHSPAGWIIAIMFGNETLAIETAPTRRAMEAGVDLVWRGLLKSGLGKTVAENKAIAAMSPSSACGDTRGHAPETSPRFAEQELAERPASAAQGRSVDDAERARPPRVTEAHPRRAADSLWQHTPFHYPEPAFDTESSATPPRRRPH